MSSNTSVPLLGTLSAPRKNRLSHGSSLARAVFGTSNGFGGGLSHKMVNTPRPPSRMDYWNLGKYGVTQWVCGQAKDVGD